MNSSFWIDKQEVFGSLGYLFWALGDKNESEGGLVRLVASVPQGGVLCGLIWS